MDADWWKNDTAKVNKWNLQWSNMKLDVIMEVKNSNETTMELIEGEKTVFKVATEMRTAMVKA